MRNLRRSTKRNLAIALSFVLMITVSVPTFYAYSPNEGQEIERIQEEVSNRELIFNDREETGAETERERLDSVPDIDRNGSETEHNRSESETTSEHNRPETGSISDYSGFETESASEHNGSETESSSEHNGAEKEPATEPEETFNSEYKQGDSFTENRYNANTIIAGAYVTFAIEGDLAIDGAELGYETDVMVLLQGITATDERGEDITHLIKVNDDGGFMDFALANNEEGFYGQVIYEVQHPWNDDIFLSGSRNVYVVSSDAMVTFGFGSLPVLISDMYELEDAIRNATEDITLMLDEEIVVNGSYDMSDWTTHTITLYPVNSQIRHFYVNGPSMLNFGGNIILDGMSVGGGIASKLGGGFDISISNVTIRNCFAQLGGAIEHRAQGTLFLENSVIEGNKALFYGGGILSMHTDGALVIGNNVEIVGNFSLGNGGGIASGGQIILIGNILIEDNHATGISGGGIFAMDISATTTIKDGVRIVGNTSESHGGGIFSAASLSIEGDVLIENNNSRSGDGGGVFLDFHAQTTISGGVNILGNTADSGGGIASVGLLEIIGDGTVIRGNHALVGSGGGILTHNAIEISGDVLIEANEAKNENGGGVYAIGGHTVVIKDGVKLIGNTAHRNGGAISNAGDTIISGDVLIDGNHAILYNGGGVHSAYSLGQVTVEDGVKIINNSAGTHGGAIYNFNSLIITDDVLIKDNEAKNGSGGGIYSFGSVLIDGNVSVKANIARNGHGGGVYSAANGSLTVIKGDVNITGNRSYSGGGGGIAARGPLEISGEGMIIYGNIASDGSGGGIIAFNTLEIYGEVLIEGNRAELGNGGGIHTNHSILITENVKILNNIASQGNGGGVRFNYNNPASINICSTVTFQGNEAIRAFNFGRALGISTYPNINWSNENSLQGRMDSGEPHLLNNYDLSYTSSGSSWALEFVRVPDNVSYGTRQLGSSSLFGLRDQVARDALASDVEADFYMGPANWNFGFEIYNTRSADWSLWLECTPFFMVNYDGTLDTDISAAVPFAVNSSNNTAKDLSVGGVRVFDSSAASISNGSYIMWHWTELFYDIELGALPSSFDGEFQSEFTWTLSGQLP